MRNLFTLIIIAVICHTGFSQYHGNSVFEFNYRMNFPVGNFANFGDPSFRGGSFDYKYYVTENIHVGALIGWTGFYSEKPRDTYFFDNGAVTAKVWNWSYISDFQVQFGYTFGTGMFIKPYLSASLGGSYNEEAKVAGTYSRYRYGSHFSYAAEAGLIVEIPNSIVAFNISTNWNHMVTDSPFYSDAMYMGLNFGISISTGSYAGKLKPINEMPK